jgi:hypothetical protein
MTDCVCQHSEDMCASKWTPDGDRLPWVCNKPAGHDGRHMACGLTHAVAMWTEEQADD